MNSESWKAWRRRLGISLVLVLVGTFGILHSRVVQSQEEKVQKEQAQEEKAQEAPASEEAASADEAHRALFLENRFPSATTCKTCHPGQYREWSVSMHAYAQMSPVFNAFHGTILKLSNGTNGDFCIRCHNQVGMNLGEPLFMSNIDRHPTSREGITCIVCHRVDRSYGKESGRLKIVEGDLFEPVYGPAGGQELKRVLESDDYQVNAERGKAGRPIHADVVKFSPLAQPGFCGSCHDVNLLNGFRLEEAFSEYKTSPAARKGITCQDCHMGKEQGKVSGYATEPAAIVGGVPTKPRKRTDHMFPGPDHSIIHPGIFPHNVDAAELATIREWLSFDYKAGWGTDEFEDTVSDDAVFPERWETADDRYDAREILDEQFALLKEYASQRIKVLQVAFPPGEIVTEQADKDGIRFKVLVRNGTDGHGVPTGFDAERVMFLQVTVKDREGTVVFKSGDYDPNGDVRDLHSLYVHNGELPLDKYLFSLQSKFITRNLRGSEREEVIAVNRSFTPLPFLRPLTLSGVLIGRPVGARKHRQGIEPNGTRWPTYEVKGSALTGKGPYKAQVKFIAGMVPVNLLDEIQHVGFDYGMSARAVADGVLAGHVTLWEREATFDAP